ncbi:hypothetical protein ACHAWF_016190 [Thalassiosira exigua]
MGVLYMNWDDTQKLLYSLQFNSSTAASIAFGTVLTHFCVSEWIWNSKMKEHHRSPAFLVSFLVFWVMWTLMFNFGVVSSISDADTIGYYIATPAFGFCGFLLNFLFSSLWNYARSKMAAVDTTVSSTTYESPLLEDENRPDELAAGIDEEAPHLSKAPPPKKAIVHYINNVKIFLTFMVILHHCAADFGGLWPGLANTTKNPHNWGSIVLNIFTMINASYFMNLFFFYSGFFVPKSFDKKGLYDFLFDRVKRLGIPYVVYQFFIGPYVYTGFMHLFFQTPFPWGIKNGGPTWFLNQLMIFSVVYAFACGKNWSPKIKCPSLLGFFVIGFLIGLISGILNLFFPSDDNFFEVPLFWQDYFSYPIYFFGGALAQRNEWMTAIKEKRRVWIYASTIFILIIVFSTSFLAENMPPVLILILKGVFWKGILSMATSLAVSVFFMDFVNKNYSFTPFFSKAMYTAYIIQYSFPMLVGLKCLFLILESTGNIAYEDPSNPSLDSVYIVNDDLIFPGWLLVGAITLIINWPLAYAIQSIPGFSQVL